MFEVVVEDAAGDVVGECGPGLFGGVVLDVHDVIFSGVPDVLRGVVVGGAGREIDRFDSLQCLSGLVQVGHRFGVVESRVIKNNSYLLVFCFAHKSDHGQGYLLGVLVALDGVDLHLLGRQAQGAEE